MADRSKRIRKGSTVRLRGKKQTAVVRAMMEDIRGGVWLDRPLGGFRAWNVADLERVPEKPRKAGVR